MTVNSQEQTLVTVLIFRTQMMSRDIITFIFFMVVPDPVNSTNEINQPHRYECYRQTLQAAP